MIMAVWILGKWTRRSYTHFRHLLLVLDEPRKRTKTKSFTRREGHWVGVGVELDLGLEELLRQWGKSVIRVRIRIRLRHRNRDLLLGLTLSVSLRLSVGAPNLSPEKKTKAKAITKLRLQP